jgi:D-alanine-D-alanine ligase
MRVVVMMGGPSAEYEVSIRSGFEVIRHLQGRDPYTSVTAVVISKKLEFFTAQITTTIPSIEQMSNPSAQAGFQGPLHPADCAALWKQTDVAVLALHGSFGEDGKIQGYLDTLGIPYTGSGVFASSVAMNKIATKYIYEQAGLATPPYSVFGKHYPQQSAEVLAQRHGFPCFVKCPQSGSSRLMGRATSLSELRELLEELQHHSDEILIESAIVGPEFSCPVLTLPDGTIKALPPIEIRPVSASFFDYTAKYTDNASLELVPAPQPPELLQEIQHCAIKAHLALGCDGVSRTDMILADSTLYLLETNTLPGLTTASLLPKSFVADGGSYEQLMDVLIQRALTAFRAPESA